MVFVKVYSEVKMKFKKKIESHPGIAKIRGRILGTRSENLIEILKYQ